MVEVSLERKREGGREVERGKKKLILVFSLSLLLLILWFLWFIGGCDCWRKIP